MDSKPRAEIPLTAAPAEHPPQESSNLQSQRIRADKIARVSLLLIVLATAVIFFSMIRAFVVPVILAAVFVGLFFPFYLKVLERTHGQKALSAFVCCATLSLGLLLPAYLMANLMTREAVRLYQAAESKGFFEESMRTKVQEHPVIKKLHLEKIPFEATLDRLAKSGAELLSNGIKVASRETFELISTLFITFFTMFYFFRDGPLLLAKLKYYSPLPDHYEEELIRQFLSVSRATIKGTLLISVIKGILGGLTFWAFGIPAPV